MELGIVGLGKMGLNMALRLLEGGHKVIAYDHHPENLNILTKNGGQPVTSVAALVKAVTPPRCLWLMIGAGKATESTVQELAKILNQDDILIDGGNANYHDSVRRAELLKPHGIYFLDVGTSGGIWGRKLGYCLMIGGDKEPFTRMEPVFKSLAPKDGYLHTGPAGAGHFTKMIHNGTAVPLYCYFGISLALESSAGAAAGAAGTAGAAWMAAGFTLSITPSLSAGCE